MSTLRFLKDKGVSAHKLDEARIKWEHLQLYGVKRGYSFSGNAMGGAGMCQIQADGDRIMAMADAKQLQDTIGGSLQDAMSGLQSITPDHDAFPKLPSFRTCVLLLGDILLLPMGFITVEKAVNDHNLGFRCMSHILFLRGLDSVKILQSSLKQMLSNDLITFCLFDCSVWWGLGLGQELVLGLLGYLQSL